MPHCIVKLSDQGTDYFLIWSTIVDAPITYGMPLDEFAAACLGGYESRTGEAVDVATRPNRAGPGECSLDREGLVRRYIRERPQGKVRL